MLDKPTRGKVGHCRSPLCSNVPKAGHTRRPHPLAHRGIAAAVLRRPEVLPNIFSMPIYEDGDAHGHTHHGRQANYSPSRTSGRDDLEQALPRFRGDAEQMPADGMAAPKKDGQPLPQARPVGRLVGAGAILLLLRAWFWLSFEGALCDLAISLQQRHLRAVRWWKPGPDCGARVACSTRRIIGHSLAERITSANADVPKLVRGLWTLMLGRQQACVRGVLVNRAQCVLLATGSRCGAPEAPEVSTFPGAGSPESFSPVSVK